jgi:TonB-dependent SusC/RagA subfamily outer membrane receptor
MKRLIYGSFLFLATYTTVSAQSTEVNKEKKITARDIRQLPDHVLYVVNGNSMGVNKRATFKHIKTRDIKKLTVLKDPAATAVYGTRGANGVVLVITGKQENINTKG